MLYSRGGGELSRGFGHLGGQVEDAHDAADAVQGDDYSEAEYMQLLTEAIKNDDREKELTVRVNEPGAY